MAKSNLENVFAEVPKDIGSAQERYFSYMLAKQQIADIAGGEDKIPKLTSERNKLRLKTLEKIAPLSESSPEYAQLVALTGGKKDKYEQSEHIADLIYAKYQAEALMDLYSPGKAVFYEQLEASAKASDELRNEANARLATKKASAAKKASLSSEILARVVGGASAATGR